LKNVKDSLLYNNVFRIRTQAQSHHKISR